MEYYNRPCAAHGLTSYRYRGNYGWIMIGATDHNDALREALRSTAGPAHLNRLQVWDMLAGEYREVSDDPAH